MTVWACLESMPGQAAVYGAWKRLACDHIDALRAAALDLTTDLARSVSCPRDCGCAHEVVCEAGGSLLGICRCESAGCDDLVLTRRELLLWRIDLTKLARRICRAFDLTPKCTDIGLYGSIEAGSWSAEGVPVILTLPENVPAFRETAASLVARLRGRFIVFAPTSQHVCSRGLEILRGVRAEFFALESTSVLESDGTLRAVIPAGELFREFRPAVKEELVEDVARSAFALVQQLDSEQPLKPPSTLTVFRLFCVNELSAARIAQKFKCSKTTVLRRLNMIRKRTGREPSEFRAFSPQFSKMESGMKDYRARRISAERLIYDGGRDDFADA